MSDEILFPTLVRTSSSEAKFESNNNNNNDNDDDDNDDDDDERKMQILPTASPVIDVRLTAKRRKKQFTITWDLPPTQELHGSKLMRQPVILGFEISIATSFADAEAGRGRREMFISSSKACSATIACVEPTMQYFVKVRTQYSRGWSDWSWPTLKVPKFKPGPPSRPRLRAETLPHQATIDLDVDSDLPPTGYEIRIGDHVAAHSNKIEVNMMDEFSSWRKPEPRPRWPIQPRTLHVRARARSEKGWGQFFTGVIKTKMTDVPCAPHDVAVTAITHDSVEATWACAKGSSNLPITDFQMQVWRADDGVWQKDRAWFQRTLRIVKNLPSNTEMLLAVKAKNDVGWGAPSTPVRFRTLAPLPPTHDTAPRLISRSISKLTVAFDPAQPNGANVLGSELRLKDSCTGEIFVTSSNSSAALKCTGLWPGTTYVCSVRSRNRAGWGSWSPSINVTTEEFRDMAKGDLVECLWTGPWHHYRGWYPCVVEAQLDANTFSVQSVEFSTRFQVGIDEMRDIDYHGSDPESDDDDDDDSENVETTVTGSDLVASLLSFR
eukprot:g2759.t1